MRSILPMWRRPLSFTIGDMLLTGSASIDAERAFARAARARRRAALLRRLQRKPTPCLHLFDERSLARARAHRRGIREIPLCAISGTVEPSRSAQFDDAFRPAPIARGRWQRVWLAEQRGAVLPPISVVEVDGAYAVRDGHHRVSVAHARGAITIDAAIDAPL
jgi:hypothetical protein